ncbi:MAG: hypothetical protein FJ077_01960 [Cyanobacteria bacterium K_DeepCast_35m_m2_023]|nr:hypothetical protein [Cyanobacteria bacterium K_DeepCast_35m_m2_023]
MTNLQGTAPSPWIPRLLLWTPVALGVLCALGVLGIGTVPLLTQLQLQERQHEEKKAQEERLPQLRVELRRVAVEQQRAEFQQQRLLQLIAGSGELVTFMAQLDREARRLGVELQLYEPTTLAAAPNPGAADPLQGQAKGTRERLDQQSAAAKAAAEAANADPLQRAGLRNTQLLLSAKGSYLSLLAFLRAIESLSLLVVQSNLTLTQAAPSPTVEMKMAVSLYSAKLRP